MKNKHMTKFVHNYLKDNVNKNDVLIDATIGNGHDTLYLANLAKFVYGFDIQQQALNNTQKLLVEHNLTNYKLFLESFENILLYVNEFKGVVFNLGYLPGANKDITTTKDITIKTLKALTNHLKKDMFIIITCYPGHDEGLKEAKAINKYILTLDSSFRVFKFELINILKRRPPFVVVIEKKD